MTGPISRVLIVEDDAMVRRLLVRHFQKKNITSVEAADAEAALALFAQPDQRFDAVVTDVHLPGMTGVEMAARIRTARPDQPIVFVTGDIDEELAERALAGGGAGYLLKPFEFFELDAAVAQALKATPAPPETAGPTTFSIQPAPDKWLEEQRRLMMAAAARPISLRPVYPGRRPFASVRLYLKIAVLVAFMVGLAWYIGYGLQQDQVEEPGVFLQESGENTVYVPYEAPSPNPKPERPRR
jgi:CheY-like chemotaxis protein